MGRTLLTLAVCAALAGCGGHRGVDRPDAEAVLLLDSRPAAVHAGIFLADARAYDEAEGVRLRVRAPAAATVAARELRSGRADLAVVRIGDLVRARRSGTDVVGVMAILQRPLSDGRRAPDHPPLLLAATRETVRDQPAVVRATVAALRRGYEETIADPPSAVTALVDRSAGLRRAETTRRLDAVLPAFTAGAPRFGWLDRDRLRAWAAWAPRAGVVRRAPDVDRAFTARFANADR